LFMVRVRWEVEDLSLEQAKEGEAFLYRFKWVDRGKMNDRVLRLWDKGSPFNLPVMEKVIPDEASEIVFNAGLEELPPGQYLAQFIAEDPWEAAYAKVSFPQSDYNVFPVEIQADQVVISSWHVQWVTQNEINSWGKLTNCPVKLAINVKILGEKNGKWVSWSSSAILYAVIPDAAPMNFLLGEEVPAVIKEDSSGITAVQVYDKKDLHHQYPFNILEDESVRKSLEEKKEEIDLRVRMADESIKEAKLLAYYKEEDHILKLEQGVRCTGKGCRKLGYTRIFPSQAAWFKHTQRTESPECKSMETNYVNVEVKVVFVWDVNPYWQRAVKAFPSLEKPVLLSSIFEKHSIEKFDSYDNIDELANALLKEEKLWFEQLINTGLIGL